MYLWHWFILEWVQSLYMSDFGKFSIFWSLTIFLSSVSFLVIEKPFLKIRIYRTPKNQ